MGTSLDTRPEPETTRLPNDFHRHSYTGAPMVPDPTRQNKIRGKKPELIAMCEQYGIEVPSKITVKQLIALLEGAGVGGPAPMVQYGRPSSFGKQIENSTNLQKWSERMVGWGVALLALDGESFDGVDALDPDAEREDRSLLDQLAVDAKRRAKAGIAAERGTHTHELTEDFDLDRDPIERMRRGEELDMPPEVQQALIDAWDQMIQQGYFEVLAVEAKCVDDRWRLAGTTDRIVRLKRDITFYCFGGEIVTVPEGTVLILDIKTGQLRLTPQGEPMYWHGYAIQIASYAQSVPFDPDTGIRGEWPFEIDRKYAIIAHLDVLAALDGEAVCRLILVDLEAGREAGDLVVAAKAWEKRKDVFSIIGASPDEVVFTVPVALPESPAEPSEETSCPTPSSTSSNPTTEASSTSSPEKSPSSTEAPSSAPATPSPPANPSPPSTSPASVTFPPIVVPNSESAPSPSASGNSSTGSGTPTTPGVTAVASVTESAPSPIPVFPPIGTTPMGASTGSAGSTSAPTSPGISNPSSTPPPSPTDLPGEVVTYEQQHAEDLKALAHEIAEWPENIRVALARSWPDPSVLPYPGTVRDGDAQWTADQLPLISKLLAAAGAPFGPWNMNDTTPPRERAFVTAPPPNDDKAPVERPTLDLLTDAVRAADATVVARINRWLTEAHEAGVAFSPLAMPNVGNYERLRLALRLAEFAEDDYDLLLALCSDEPDAGPVGPLIGRMTGAMAQAAWQRIDDLANGRSALLYTDDGAPRIVPTIGEST